jgi:predicted phage tail protein
MYKVGEIKISGKYMSAIYRTYTINTGAIGKYDIRCRCIYKDHEGSGDAHAIYWSKLSQIIYDDFTYPNCTLLSVQALGSDLISRSTPKITYELTRSYVWVWNPDTESYEQKAANNPAWAAYWMLHRVYYMKNINTGEWEYIVRGIPASRIVYSEFEAWASFCSRSTSMWT